MESFYTLSLIISTIFVISFIIIFFCALKIYFNVEKTMMKNKRNDQDE
ncbi:hypothetical protein EJK17_03795 [Lactobacillus xujianguonis]|uniref:Uncharacterized protein n=1 Tax=Lactobacillus xujianguonis TaxID=2495899 RepID=A0A437SW73_9LACO|nr:hypothetical protein EJK17_03795 [Lactobacillus xujianguonis]RVU77523.1 hypothetical protein EJK20_01620 [Lactobacillus xujianguonis]